MSDFWECAAGAGMWLAASKPRAEAFDISDFELLHVLPLTAREANTQVSRGF